MTDAEKQRELNELEALFGVSYEIWDTKHLLEHFDPKTYQIQLLKEWFGPDYYFPDTQDKVGKMERMPFPFTDKDIVDALAEQGFSLGEVPLIHLTPELIEEAFGIKVEESIPPNLKSDEEGDDGDDNSVAV